MSRGSSLALALGLGLALLGAMPAQGQRVTVGPVGVLADYKEVTAGLRYHGKGFGGALSASYRKLSAQATVTRLTFDPTSASTAGLSFKATQVDAWLGYDMAQYVAIEVGLIRRTADPEFEAQSLGAVRAGARSAYEIGPGAVVSLRADYLAASKFSGGGRAPFSLDLGLGLDVRVAGRLHGTAAYEFQRVGRKTNPGGTGEIDSPIQETVARLGLAVAF